MLVLSTVLVDVVKSFVGRKDEPVCLCASHYGTVGAVLKTERKYGFSAEEDLFRLVVREAVDELNKQGYNVDQTGIDEHEQGFSANYYSKYSVVISNHFDYDKGERATLYTNEALAQRLNTIRNTVSPIKESVLRYRPELKMTHMANGVIFEWFKSTDQLAVDTLLIEAGEGRAADAVVGDEHAGASGYRVIKDYAETGRFTCKEAVGIVGYHEPELARQIDASGHLEYDEYVQYNHVYYIADDAGLGYVVVQSATSGHFFPVRTYSVANGFGALWGTIV
jgi:hypothetical protein